jgi:hypothetical protein
MINGYKTAIQLCKKGLPYEVSRKVIRQAVTE